MPRTSFLLSATVGVQSACCVDRRTRSLAGRDLEKNHHPPGASPNVWFVARGPVLRGPLRDGVARGHFEARNDVLGIRRGNAVVVGSTARTRTVVREAPRTL